jgi:ABC-type multidrug transport system fused ATPase/permease subunit
MPGLDGLEVIAELRRQNIAVPTILITGRRHMPDDRRFLPRHLYRYIVATSWPHQIPLLALTIATFLLQVVPLELQRRIVNDAVKNRHYQVILVLCAVYLAAVTIQGLTKLAMNLYRGWIGENAKRDLRRRLYRAVNRTAAGPAADAQGTAVSMVVAEVEPVGAFVGSSVSEPLLQFGILASVLAYIIHLEIWMALAALALFVPQLIFVPLMQHAMNRRTGIRVWVLRQIGGGVISPRNRGGTADPADIARIDRVLQLNIGILKFKFTMNFLMNLCSQLQIIAALMIGGWLVLHERIEIGGIVAFISAVKQLNDPWGDVVNFFRDASLSHVKYRLLTTAVAEFAGEPPSGAASLSETRPAGFPSRGRRNRWRRGIRAAGEGLT